MRGSRLKILAISMVVLVAACWWAWQNRDQIAPGLVNPMLEGSRVESIRGLEVGLKSVSLEQITLTLESGSKIALRDIRLQQPLDLLFGARENRSRLAIAELGYLPVQQIAAAPPPAAPPATKAATEDTPRTTAETPPPPEPGADELRLGELLRLLRRYLPERIEISDLRWLGGPLERGQLALTRDHNTDSVDLRITREQRRLHLQLQGRAREYHIQMELLAGAERAATLSGRLNRLDAEHWKTQLRLQLALEQLRKLPLPQNVSKMVTTAAGAINGELNSRFPDRLLRLGEYRDTTIDLAAKDATLTLPESLLGAPLHIAFETPEATTIAFASLRPFRPRDITGSGRLTVAPVSGEIPLLSAGIDTRVSQGRPVISLAGEMHFGALAPLLQSGRWQSLAGKLKLSSPEGDGGFRGTATLEPLERIAAGDAATVKALEFTLLPRTRIGVTVSDSDAGPPGQYDWRSGTATLELAEPLTLTAAQWPGPFSLAAPALELEALPESGDTAVSVRASDIECRFGDGRSCEVKLSGTARLPEMEASGSIELKGQSPGMENGKPPLRGEYRSDDLHLRLRDKYALDASTHGDFTLSGDDLNGKGALQVGAIDTRFTWRHRLDKGHGRADFELPPAGFSREAPLSDAVTGLPVDLVAGSVAAGGRISWPQGDGEDKISLTLDKVAAVYGDMFAVDISGTIAAIRRGGHPRGGLWITEAPQRIQIGSVDVGLPIDNIRFALSLDRQRDLSLTELGAELLGGQLQSPKLTWNLAGEERRSEVRIDGISLEKLAGEMEADNFAASGILDLQVPLLIDGNGVTVEQGRVEARPPGGRLRYYGAFSPDMLSGNPQLKLIAGALEDYNYRELSGTLEYPPSGDMRLQLKLVGRSKSIAGDRDLVINLNLENNIPDMLRSLQASRDLTEALEEQVQ